jgi:hypothetical protein
MPLLPALLLALAATSPLVDSSQNPEETMPAAAIAEVAPSLLVDPGHEAWQLPALRASYRTFLHPAPQGALDRAAEALATGDVPMACALYLATRRAAPVAPDDPIAESIRMAAVESLARWDIRWGAQPLLSLAANPALDASPRVLANTLLDQLGDDAIRGNAHASCEFYLVGLQEDWDTWLAVLTDRCARQVKAPPPEGWHPFDQQQTLLSSLLFLAAMYGPEGLRASDTSWWYLAYGHGQARFEGYRKATPAQQSAMLRLARLWHDGDAIIEGEYELHPARGNRHMAWWMLEGTFPQSAPMLRDIILNTSEWSWKHHRRALSVFLIHNPAMLLHEENRRLLPEVVASYKGIDYWRASRIGLLLAPRSPEFEGGCFGVPSLQDIVEYEPTWLAAANVTTTVAPHREPLLQLVRDELARVSDPTRQLNLTAFLVAARDDKSAELIASALISNFVDDDVFANRERARWIMQEHGPIDTDAMLAGLNVGIEMRDLQLVKEATSNLLLEGRKDLLEVQPKLGDFLLDQLADDDISRNAEAASAILQHLDPDSVRRLFARRPPVDEQEIEYRDFVLAIIKMYEEFEAQQ